MHCTTSNTFGNEGMQGQITINLSTYTTLKVMHKKYRAIEGHEELIGEL